ncbi:MAG: PEP-CTERM sorting domain-containing protein [Planctomycetia bacterium]|nr:PEP-CTERM sorting domain-containing protein [Planctomycetia bacterium]
MENFKKIVAKRAIRCYNDPVTLSACALFNATAGSGVLPWLFWKFHAWRKNDGEINAIAFRVNLRGGGKIATFLRAALLAACLVFPGVCSGEVYYYSGFNNGITGTGYWTSSSGSHPTSFVSTDTYVLDRGTDANNATTRLIGPFTFGGTLYAGYQDDGKTGTLTYADTTARMCTKGNSQVNTVTFTKMYMGNLRINQWTTPDGSPSLPYWAVFKGDIVFGDGTNAGGVLNAGNVLFDARANEGGTGGFRNLVFADSLTGTGTFFMANVKNGHGVLLAGENADLGKVDWTIRQGTLTVGTAANTTLGLSASASRLGTNSTVTFDSNAVIPLDNTNGVDYTSSAANGTDKPALVFYTPSDQTSDNSTVTVTTASGTNSTLSITGAGTVLLGSASVSNFLMEEGTFSNASDGTFRVTDTANIRGGKATLNGADVDAKGFYVGVYTTEEAGTSAVKVSDVTINGSVTTADLDIGVNNKIGTTGSTTTKFTMEGDLLTVNGGTGTLSWACKAGEVAGTDRVSNDKTVIDLSGVENVSLTASALNIAYANGNGTWSCGANVQFGTNNTIVVDTFRFADSNAVAGLYDDNVLVLGEGNNIIQANDIIWGGYKSGWTIGGAEVSVRLGENDAKTASVVIGGKTAGSKANLSVGRNGGYTGMANSSTVDLTNAATAALTLGTLTIAPYGGGSSYTGKLLLGENVSLSADSIRLGTSGLSNATLSIQSGTLDLYGAMTESGTSVFQMDEGEINLHIRSESQLATPLLCADTLTLSEDVLLDFLFDGAYQPSVETPEITVFQTSTASMTALSDLVGGDWSKLFGATANHYFNFSADGTNLYANIDTAAVPEPATWVLMLLGCLLWCRRRIHG